jgi:hypothetical protein
MYKMFSLRKVMILFFLVLSYSRAMYFTKAKSIVKVGKIPFHFQTVSSSKGVYIFYPVNKNNMLYIMCGYFNGNKIIKQVTVYKGKLGFDPELQAVQYGRLLYYTFINQNGDLECRTIDKQLKKAAVLRIVKEAGPVFHSRLLATKTSLYLGYCVVGRGSELYVSQYKDGSWQKNVSVKGIHPGSFISDPFFIIYNKKLVIGFQERYIEKSRETVSAVFKNWPALSVNKELMPDAENVVYPYVSGQSRKILFYHRIDSELPEFKFLDIMRRNAGENTISTFNTVARNTCVLKVADGQIISWSQMTDTGLKAFYKTYDPGVNYLGETKQMPFPGDVFSLKAVRAGSAAYAFALVKIREDYILAYVVEDTYINAVVLKNAPNENIPVIRGDVIIEWDQVEDSSGVSGYGYIVNQKPDSIPGLENLKPDETVLTPGSLLVPGINYVHVAAFDIAGNMSEVVHIKIIVYSDDGSVE